LKSHKRRVLTEVREEAKRARRLFTMHDSTLQAAWSCGMKIL
jgi:hypothetical protein